MLSDYRDGDGGVMQGCPSLSSWSSPAERRRGRGRPRAVHQDRSEAKALDADEHRGRMADEEQRLVLTQHVVACSLLRVGQHPRH